MKENNIPMEKLMEILSHINSVKVRVGENVHWVLFPLVSFGGDEICISAKKDSKNYFDTNHNKLLIKFKFDKMEYVIGGEIINKGMASQVVSIKIQNPIEYRALNFLPRFDTNMSVSIKGDDGTVYGGIIQDISQGGANLTSTINADLSTELSLNINIDQTQKLTTVSKILSKKGLENNFFNYGVKFINLNKNSKNLLNNKMEEIKESSKTSHEEFRIIPNAKQKEYSNIAILSYEILGSKYIEDALESMGEKNYYMVGTFGALKASMVEEEPHLIVVDGTKSTEARVASAINKIIEHFEDLNIILVAPLKFENINETITQNDRIDIIYYPLIQNELEQSLLKYL